LWPLVGLHENSRPNLAIVIRLVIAYQRNAPVFGQQIGGHVHHSGPFPQIEAVSGDSGMSYDRRSPLVFVWAPENPVFPDGAPQTQLSNVYSNLPKIDNYSPHH